MDDNETKIVHGYSQISLLVATQIISCSCKIHAMSVNSFVSSCPWTVNVHTFDPLRLVSTMEFFHVYHFWNFLIFKCTWVCSSSSSKNKNIFLNLSINSTNLKMSIYLSISKMCSSLFLRGNQGARIANVKRTTQSQDAELSANLYQRNALDLWTGALTLATSSLITSCGRTSRDLFKT